MCSLYEKTIQTLAKAKIQSPCLEARLLIADALGIAPDDVCGQTVLTEDISTKLEQNIQKRLEGMPLDKILGRKGFYKYDFTVSEDVLSPRPDTEILLESALEIAHANQFQNVLELGVGSGCILLSIACEILHIQCVGIDISSKALNIARQNAQRLNVDNRCRLICKSWFDDDLVETFGMRFDMVVSNPPYIKTGDISKLDVSVQKYDPFIALDGGKDGLKHYARIAEIAPKLLKKGGYILLEIGFGQSEDVCRIFETAGLKHIKTLRDLADIERVLVFQM